MTKAEYYIAKIIFKNKILQYKGQAFEDFLIQIMEKYNSNFKPIKAYGNIGDKKNDGFDPTTGTYYQIFAPEDILKDRTINEAVKKLKEDFESLYEKWDNLCSIKKYYFAVNDRYNGVPAPVVEMAIQLGREAKYKGIEINIFMAKDLEKIFSQLGELDIQDIIGYIPDEALPMIEFEALSETVSYLLSVDIPINGADNLVVPDFDEKISFNGLTDYVNHLLTTGSYQEGILVKYFNENPGVKEVLQKKFNSLYGQSKAAVNDSQDNYPDLRFFYILEKACVKGTLPIRTSVLVLMAYYFSSCDIFEEPEYK